jgi:hypothetical protein
VSGSGVGVKAGEGTDQALSQILRAGLADAGCENLGPGSGGRGSNSHHRLGRARLYH